jgi:ribonuclease H / adenosylcobalamin/alpha-ribazole phosphatase
MELVLVRHAEPTEDSRGRCCGRLDIELSASGRTQCARLVAALAGAPVAAVVSSPLRRARETAQMIAEAHELPVVVVDDLTELDFGELEGKTYDEIASAWPDLYERWMAEPASVRFPGGEGYDDLQTRVARAVSGLRASYDGCTVVAVTHGGVVRAVLADALGLAHDRIFRLAIEPASLTRVSWSDGVPIVRSVNLTLNT